MDKKINKIIEEYVCKLKNDLREKFNDMSLDNKISDNLIKYIYNYERLVIDKEDFCKRKRAKNTVPSCERCSGRRANGEQCTRRRKKDNEFCGTHLKGIPNGKVDSSNSNESEYVYKELSIIDNKGIVYYVGSNGDRYEPVDVLSGSEVPGVCRVVGV